MREEIKELIKEIDPEMTENVIRSLESLMEIKTQSFREFNDWVNSYCTRRTNFFIGKYQNGMMTCFELADTLWTIRLFNSMVRSASYENI